ncbi:hypothetical protein ACC779_07770 [Rhizobium ruizarguesonis]
MRDFELVTAVDKTTLDYLRDVDRLDLVKRTGTDRDESSLMWNAPGFDFDRDADDSGRTPSDIIYAFKVDLRPTPYLVHFNEGPAAFDLTTSLSATDGMWNSSNPSKATDPTNLGFTGCQYTGNRSRSIEED